MSTDLKGKVAIVTGAARGLGLTLVEALARAGMRVAGVDVRGDLLASAMANVSERQGGDLLAIEADLGREDCVVAMVERTRREFGRIDVLVNNAGVRLSAPVWETDTASWDRVHDSNLKAPFLCTREVLAQDMLHRGEGALVFISSLAGKRSLERGAAYCASKRGVLGFAESVAKDLKGTGIRVTAIAPGRIETPMARESEAWRLGLDWLDPAHVATAVIFTLRQDSNTIVPELQLYHRAQL